MVWEKKCSTGHVLLYTIYIYIYLWIAPYEFRRSHCRQFFAAWDDLDLSKPLFGSDDVQ